MAGIGNRFVDLIDIYKSEDPDGSIAHVIEMLMQKNPMLQDAYTVECNDGTTHQHTIRTGLPTVAWGRLYKGISNSKSTKAQVRDNTGFVEGLSTIDTRVLDLSGGNSAAIRLSEADSFIEAMSQEVQAKMIYGNDNTTPEEFMGLAPRFNDTTAKNGNQIIDAGGIGADNTSIWMITWGENTVCTLYPKGTQGGIKREDHGKQRVLDDSGNAYYAMEESFTQHIGLAVKDWRYVVRIANIDVSDMKAGLVDLYSFLTAGYYQHEGRRQPMNASNTIVYCNTDVLEALDIIGTNAGTGDNFVRLQFGKDIQGEEVQMYRKFAIRETDALLNTEAQVV